MFDGVEKLIGWIAGHWKLVLPLVLGFSAVWLLLPRGRPRWALYGTIAGAAALGVGGVSLLRFDGDSRMLGDALFCVFAGMAVVAAACMIAQTNPVYAALWFAIVVLSVCGLFLLRSAPFLAAATIIIYAGAIIVTFLFVIMLAQQSGLAGYDRRSREPLLASLAGLLLAGGLLYVLQVAHAVPADNGRLREWQRDLDTLDRVVEHIDQARVAIAASEELDVVTRRFYVGEKLIWVIVDDRERRYAPDRRGTADRCFTAWIDEAAGPSRNSELDAILGDFRKHVSELQERILEADPRLQEQARVRSLGSPLSRVHDRAELGKVKGLGRSLFTDYLWVVQIAGTLLLVATVAAILIAYRRKEAGP